MKLTVARWIALAACSLLGVAVLVADDSEIKNIVTGTAAFTSFETESPGTVRKITVADLPAPFATKGVSNGPKVVSRPDGVWPKTVEGFKVELYASNLNTPREIRTAPNGDMFVSESYKGEVIVFRGITADGKPEQQSTFATGLKNNFGIAWYPLGNNPQWIYFANTNSVVRYPYHNGDLKATGPAETVIAGLPAGGGHWTRDLAFSPDGKYLFVSVGSASNIDNPDTHPSEHNRADILEYTPEGKFIKIYAAGIRNPVGIAVNPTTGQLWCSVNERDMLGDNLVPDYITSVKEDGFYGWPFYYMGNHHDPRLPEKPELGAKTTVPDVLLQPHNASLEMTFYEGKQFPEQYHGDIFAAEHGSWNKAQRAGYEVIRVPLNNGHAPGEYEDFVTGFVLPDGNVWGRPVGVAVAPDGSLMVTDDGSKSIWRVSYSGK
ncbi:MAG: sorbosone dehydrogenase family protein [Acidobacteriaceae bacterium]|nr:sorbosone dehydrogenase family protein [Acidobacteriaceae bacterium]